MFELTKILTTAIMPPFNVLILWVFALLLWGLKRKRCAYISALLGIIVLYLFSIPYTSQKMHDSLTTEDNLTLSDYQSAQAIVLLGGGLRDSKELFGPLAVSQIALERVRYAAFLQKETRLPLLITGSTPNGTSEADVMAKELLQFFNVPTKWIEPHAKTTEENARFSRALLAESGVKKIILVTNQWHMKRARLLFEREGFEVLPASVGNGITPVEYGLTLMHFLPQSGALHSNMHGLKEWIGYWKEK